MKIGGPSILLMCLDWWIFEVMLILSGLFGVDAQASMIVCISMIVCMNICSLFYRFGQGLDQTACLILGR